MKYRHPKKESDLFRMLDHQREGTGTITNKLRSRIRVRCEHVFGRVTQLTMDRLRSIGSARAHQQIGLSNLVYNMDRCLPLQLARLEGIERAAKTRTS